ncbi:MAG TPA: GNAT family N-acetyltransferase, partial [bacterium]|nr:GNAT family N-acetyltransferase [bacterium]
MKIIECDKVAWDNFVDTSPQGNIFCKSCFLESYQKRVKYLQCIKGNEVYAGFAFVESSRGIEPMPYQVYCGLIFKNLEHLKMYKQNEFKFAAASCFAKYLFNNYDEIHFTNHWDVIDFRPFDWLNYFEREKGYYRIDVRYTSLLDISRPDDNSGYARLRNRDLKKGTEAFSFITKESNDIELLNHLHDMNFKKQGIVRTKNNVKALMNICQNLMRANAGKLFVTSVNDEPVVASLFIYDRFRAYHLFVGTDLRFRDLGVGTKNLRDCCAYLNETLSIKELDTVGINSPQRSSYKLSYGGSIVPYY